MDGRLLRPKGALVFAHRGASGTHVENTVGAVREAAARGADGLEIDVMLTHDDEVVVFHDDDMTRLAGVSDRIADLTLERLAAIPLPGGARVPTLESVLQVWPGDRVLNVELKAGGPKLVSRTLEILGDRQGVILSSFDVGLLGEAAAADPPHEISVLLSTTSPPWLWARGAARFRAAGIHIEHHLCAGPLVRRYVDAGLSVGAFTVNDDARASILAARGVTRLFTDFP